MAVQSGPARRAKPRSRPAGVHPEAVWDSRARAWKDGDYWFDERAAASAVAFFSDHICLTEGEWAGRPFVLEPWQENDIIRPLFGWKREDGLRRYRRCYVWVPRKNGKTELAAGIALLLLLGDSEQAGQVFSIATDKDQARIVFDKATAMVGKSQTLSADLVCLKPSIYCPALNASFKPLSGKPGGKHGLSASGLIGDEIHEWVSGELYQFIHDSEAARRQPLEFLISTAGKKGGYGEEVWEECQKILDGTIDDPETLVVVYAADPEDDWTKPEIWAKANPNLGVSKKLDTLAADARRAQQLPRLENDFKRYHLNLWTEQAVRWLPIDALDDDGNRFGWDHCTGPIDWKDLDARLIGKRCFGGLDLSSTTDLSALVWWFPIQDGLDTPVVLVRFFKPKDLIKAHSARDKLPYDRWVKEGALFATPGNVVDYAFIQDQIYRDAERYRIAFLGDQRRETGQGGLAIDRWNATETTVKLEQEGLPVVMFGQGFASMAAPTKELERLVLCNGFHHGGHPVLRRHAQVVAVETDPAGNIKPAKNKSTERIDGIVGLCMAIGIAAKDTGDFRSVYESRGIRMV
ncbi:terminase TerL endonuclease subunit [Chelatococcus sp.]|uniref:terminase large subunit n=1 Tax=Chelatococcus sp. TaxID=1953771 RepID=UPI001EC9DC4C|nr:terminase TerL endonuclease subunit [Chelatococcus sp.]MBX3543590.1 terminase large subunit [Chelatococcus sp.]